LHLVLVRVPPRWDETGRAKGHDVLAVVDDPALAGSADEQILAHAAATGRALVTANIRDFMPLDARYRAASQAHAGLILVSAKTFPKTAPSPQPSPARYLPSSTSQARLSPARYAFCPPSNRLCIEPGGRQPSIPPRRARPRLGGLAAAPTASREAIEEVRKM
jgi:hypothetical protein